MRHQKVLPLLAALALLGCGAPVATSSSSPAPAATTAPVKFEGAAFSFLRPQAWQEGGITTGSGLVLFNGPAGLVLGVSTSSSGLTVSDIRDIEERDAKKNENVTLKISEYTLLGGDEAYRLVVDRKYQSNPDREGSIDVAHAGKLYSIGWHFKYQDPAAAQVEKDIQALLDSWTWK